MFYVFNVKEEIKNNDPYKIALKSIIKEIKNTDFETMGLDTDCFGNTSIDLLISWIVNYKDEITVGSLEKKLKNLYEEFSMEELYYMYITSLNDVLADEFLIESAMDRGINIKEEISGYKDALANLRLKSLIGTLCIYSLILNHQLLEKKLESVNIEDDYNQTKIIRSIRKDRVSLYKGIRGIPILMSEKEARYVSELNNKMHNSGLPKKFFEYTGVVYSYRSLEMLIAKYCFGNNFDKYVDVKEFVGEEVPSVSETELFLAPVQIFNSRKIIPAKEGVVLKFNAHKNIESVYITECSRINYRIIFGVVRYTNGYESPMSLRINYNSTVTLSCYHVVDVMSVILDYYKIPEDKLKVLGEIPKVPEYEVLSGVYWELRKNGYETASDAKQRKLGKNVKREYSVKPGTYVRKSRGSASEQTKEFAKKIRIALEEGMTLIKEKDRVFFREIEELNID